MAEDIYQNLIEKLDAGQKAALVTRLVSGDQKSNLSAAKILITEDDLRGRNHNPALDELLLQKIHYALETGILYYLKDIGSETYLIEPFFPEPRLIVLGGGHIAQPLSEFGSRLGFAVTVIDDRPSFANPYRFPDAEQVICESFERCFDLVNLNESAFVVIVTRGHRHDLHCLKQVLRYRTAYVGMIGSRRRVRMVRRQLLSEGYTEDQLLPVNAPIGLDIGAVTPEEIALSIIAQVVSYRRLVPAGPGNTQSSKVIWPELDGAVLEELAKGNNDPLALVTVVSTKGSVPRKAGAKMLVWPDGKTLGSIGGGCSESEVAVVARDVIRNGGYQERFIDMTGLIAEEEGMVCGGIMQVLIEAIRHSSADNIG